jgi:Arm DNA-binding domain
MPKTETFTERDLAKAKPGMTHVADVIGLYIWKNPKTPNRGRWIWRFSRFKGEGVTTMSLGTWPEVKLERAKFLVAHYRGLIADGRDPREMKKQNLIEMTTFGQVVEEFIEQDWGESKHYNARLYLCKYGKPLWTCHYLG